MSCPWWDDDYNPSEWRRAYRQAIGEHDEQVKEDELAERKASNVNKDDGGRFNAPSHDSKGTGAFQGGASAKDHDAVQEQSYYPEPPTSRKQQEYSQRAAKDAAVSRDDGHKDAVKGSKDSAEEGEAGRAPQQCNEYEAKDFSDGEPVEYDEYEEYEEYDRY